LGKSSYGDGDKKEYKDYNIKLISTNQESKEAKLYKSECGSCHMAYQAEFLPKRSWKKLMEQNSLENHFGVDASFDKEDIKRVLEFLIKNAGDSKKVSGEFEEFIEIFIKTHT